MAELLTLHDFSQYDVRLWPADPLAREGLQIFLLESEVGFRQYGQGEISQQSINFIAYYVVNGWASLLSWPRDVSIRTVRNIYGGYTDRSGEDFIVLVRHTLRWALPRLENGDGGFTHDVLENIRRLTSDL